eukprot:TRINITY_DN8703_c0_g1_i1.p1 TRINITY_DN8703_c0_g1~~TRINITY_DN8703_c0_g1_i1.p1  ORF type:complete len:404 (+),score=32.64 TRINITY_DN8703_c0_g1_i1:492-1703(+)
MLPEELPSLPSCWFLPVRSTILNATVRLMPSNWWKASTAIPNRMSGATKVSGWGSALRGTQTIYKNFNSAINIKQKNQQENFTMKTQKIMHLFARTSVHVGAGNSVGVIDSPVMRERHTQIPIIPGSSLKGVLADLWNDEKFQRTPEGQMLFGSTDANNASAGQLLIGEARVLAFPVRSAKGSFAWITCPLALARYKRDAKAEFEVPEIENEMDCLVSNAEALLLNGKVILEEYCFTFKGETTISSELVEAIDDEVWADLGKRFVIVSDEMFSYFVENACEVVTRICVDDETGTVKNGALFNQEQVPSETMFYAVIGAMDKKDLHAKEALGKLETKLKDIGNTLQVGGDETIGLGYCSVNLIEGGKQSCRTQIKYARKMLQPQQMTIASKVPMMAILSKKCLP